MNERPDCTDLVEAIETTVMRSAEDRRAEQEARAKKSDAIARFLHDMGVKADDAKDLDQTGRNAAALLAHQHVPSAETWLHVVVRMRFLEGRRQ